MWQPDGLENEPDRAHIGGMEKLPLTIEVLRRLVETDDAVATLVAEQRISEFLSGEPQLDQKIENLKLLRRGFLPICLRLEDRKSVV